MATSVKMDDWRVCWNKRYKADSLDGVRRALAENKFRRRIFCGAGIGDLSLFTLMFAALFVLLWSAVSEAHYQKLAAASALRGTLSLDLYSGATDAQIQPFLQALIGLPEVGGVEYITKETLLAMAGKAYPKEVVELQGYTGGNPFNDRIEIRLKPGADAGRLFSFLRSKQLRSVLQPRYLWNLPRQVSAQRENSRSHRRSYFLFVLIAAASLFAVFVASSQYVAGRIKSMKQQTKTLRMMGAGEWVIYKPFIGELCILLAGGAAVASYAHIFLISNLMA